jgi:hypothetical protein
MNEFAETHKREADSENKEEISVSKKLRVESSEENASKEVSFLIEADAAEDKGLRHSMEDEWVVLLDAARDYPGNLRFLIIYFSSIFDNFVQMVYCKLGKTRIMLPFLICNVIFFHVILLYSFVFIDRMHVI